MAAYAAALTSRKIDNVSRLYVAMPKKAQDDWKAYFDLAKDLNATFAVDRMDFSKVPASIIAHGQLSYTNERRKCLVPLTLQIKVVETPAGWRISTLDQQSGTMTGC